MNTCATVTVGTWVERLNACKTEEEEEEEEVYFV